MKGKVYIIGVGPGAIDLLTIRAIHAIRKADIVLYDALINQQIIDIYCRDKMRIFVGKRLREDDATLKQDKIHQMMIGFAKSGRIVARLKNGDPLVFGRGAEEAEVLKEFNIPYEYIPGITAVSGAASYASIPLTHRKLSSSLIIATGNFADDKENVDSKRFFRQIAQFDGTVAIYMGSDNIKEIASYFIEYGKAESMPIAIISNATTPLQKVQTFTLKEVARKHINIKRPAILIIGNVVSLRQSLDWFKMRPLLNKLFIITRPIENSLHLNSLLIEEGATTFLFPFIQYKNLTVSKSILKNLPKFSWIVFKSQYAVKVFFEVLFSNKMDIRSLRSVKIAAIGKVTAQKLEQFGLIPDLIPDYFSTEVLTKKMLNKLSSEDKILICTANIRNEMLEKELDKKYIKYKLLPLYAIEPISDSVMFQKWQELNELLKNIDDVSIIFASSQTVRNFFVAQDKFARDLDIKKWRFYSIGKETTSTLKKHGISHIFEAKLPTEDSIIEKILQLSKCGSS